MKKKQTSRIFTQTIKERGAKLPIGIIDPSGSSFHQDIEIRPWRMKEERELGILRDKNKDETTASYVSMILATMCTKLGHHDFSNMSFDKKRLIISQMYMADVFYTYVFLRINSLGSNFPIKFTPQWTNKSIEMNADLYSIETICADGLEATKWEYKLINPIEIRGKQVTAFEMNQQKWYTLEGMKPSNSLDQSIAKQTMILASIESCKEIDEQIILTSQELDELSKLDLERLSFLIDDKSLGPQMVLEGSHNGREFTAPIDWGYDNFFVVSSV